MIIYALVDPRDDAVRYVGKTHRTAHRRLRRHLAPCYLTGATHKERWIRSLLKIGLEPRIEVVERCESAAELCEREQHWIAHYGRTCANLTNATPGGDGIGFVHTPESREKIRLALTGKPKSEEHRLRSGLASRGRKASEATRAKLSLSHRGPRAPLSETHRISLSAARGGRPFVDQHGTRYETQKGAARLLGVSVGHINEVLHGKRHHVHGLVFLFVDEECDLRVRQFPRQEQPS